MIQTSRQSFIRQAAEFKTVPVTAELIADTLTPIQLFETFNKRAAFLLESRDPLSLWSEYSFIGIDPFLYLEEHNGRFEIRDHSERTLSSSTSFTTAWDQAAGYLNVSPILPDLPFPGGAVGAFSFEAMSLTEDRVKKNSSTAASFVFCRTILAFHHVKEELTIIHFQEAGFDYELAYQEAVNQISCLTEQLSGPAAPVGKRIFETEDEEAAEDPFEEVKSNISRDSFLENVKRVKSYIESGDAFQVVLSQRFEMDTPVNGLHIYRVLRKQNPSPYMFYIRTEQEELIGSSPERLVKIESDRSIDIHPIAGTRKRGATEAEDREFEAELLADEKEKAEHFMLVDLARNDLGRVCRYGSVETYEKLTVTRFSKVMHIISKVKGQLRDDVHPAEALLSAHPAGTVSGAPKIRAVEIIQELEKDTRGSYAGTVAYFGFNGTVDSCIAIRTIRLRSRKAYVQAGAGIVYDSVPELEWEETRNKASAMLAAVKQAKKSFEQEESVR
ncbi:anthranilate synthase component I family protein [Alteribacter natronophilus]|uniref:anthranilate synthase component I family protein n=1 Tax=Alteribacter natronophilus TaxID=2583810 RepID=UPI00110F69B2|nr:chorismate-binding protein [Alteribacter natronophilus]TMW73593.1 anthranilate synthase component I [Alteribacter natronophilus]